MRVLHPSQQGDAELGLRILALYEELALARLTPEERVHIQRLQDADLDRWYA